MGNPKIVSLCESCDKCPVVEIKEGEVLIGELGNIVKLKKDEWETLKSKIKTGEL